MNLCERMAGRLPLCYNTSKRACPLGGGHRETEASCRQSPYRFIAEHHPVSTAFWKRPEQLDMQA